MPALLQYSDITNCDNRNIKQPKMTASSRLTKEIKTTKCVFSQVYLPDGLMLTKVPEAIQMRQCGVSPGSSYSQELHVPTSRLLSLPSCPTPFSAIQTWLQQCTKYKALCHYHRNKSILVRSKSKWLVTILAKNKNNSS